jgi:integrase/recombinase XerD
MMRWKNFNGRHLCFQIRKTKEDLSIKLPEKSLDILRFYQELAQWKYDIMKIDPESFIFPLPYIDPLQANKLKLFNAISSAAAYTNKDLRKLSELAGIGKKYHFIKHGIAGQ